ncbi:MAG: hypothetical protein K9H49_19355 [Bacteroidales bacterium]|nr:hypothetical protein [Bacteroidales bacterium]MCF8391819.1 hypothetical protein [Bacteroidales bacterium]
MKNSINFRSTTIILLLALSAVPLVAQPPSRQGQGQEQGQRQPVTEASVKERVIKLSKTLECTDEQQKKLLEYEVAQYKTGQKEREKFAGDREAMQSYMQEQRKLREKKYEEILTPEQLKKYNQMMEERRQQRPEGSQSQGAEGQRSRGRGGE